MGCTQMSRIRTIKPEFWRHEELSALPEAAHMLAAALLNYADDEGYFNANPRLVHAECCPLREPSVSVHESLLMLSKINYIRLGTGQDGKRYGHIQKFADHQRINRPTPSKINSIRISWDYQSSAHTHLTEPSLPEKEQGTGNREQGTGNVVCFGSPSKAGIATDVSGKRKPALTISGKHNYPEAFEATWRVYPPRAGGNSKRAAFVSWQARLREGADPSAIEAGVLRYAAYLKATGKANSEFVKQAATFFGPNEHYLEPWAPPTQAAPANGGGQVPTISSGDW